MFNKIIFLIVLAAIAAVVDAQGFYGSCFAPLLQANNRYLFSTCSAHAVVGGFPKIYIDTRRNSLLDLGLCIGNDDGRLVRKDGGNFYESCTACHLDKGSVWLSCECTARGQDKIRSRIDLDDYLSNWDGKVCCGKDRCAKALRSWIPGHAGDYFIGMPHPPKEIDGFEFGN